MRTQRNATVTAKFTVGLCWITRFCLRSISKKSLQLTMATLAKRFIEGLFAPVGIGSFDYDSTIHELKYIELSTLKSVVYGVGLRMDKSQRYRLQSDSTVMVEPISWMNSIRTEPKQKRLSKNLKRCLRNMGRVA